MKEYRLLIPFHFNDGTIVPDEIWRGTQREMAARFNGWTRGSTVHGEWKDENGRTILDISRQYFIASDSPGQMTEFCQWLCEQHKQECIYVAQCGEAKLVHARTPETV